MGLIHQTNAGFVGNRGVSQSPSAQPNITPSFYLPGDSYTDTIAGLTGTVNGNVAIVTDNPFGHASARSFHFTGGNIEWAGNGAHAYASSGMTISFWMKWAGFGQNGWQTMCSRRDGSGTTFEIGLSDGSNVHDDKMFYYYDGSSVIKPWRTQPPKGSWVHVCLKITTNNGQGRLFMNGILVSSFTANINNPTTSIELNLGGLGSNNQDFRGHICDFAIFRGFPTNIFGSSRDATFGPPSAPIAGENVVPPGVQQIQTI